MSSTSQTSHHNPFQFNYSELDDDNFQIRGSTLYTILLLLAAVFTVVFLFLYGRWICQLARSHGIHEQPQQGLDEAGIEKLSVVLYKVCGEYTDRAECCICLGIFREKDEVKVLPSCGHCFHSSCVDMWLKGHSSCPLCRAPIIVDLPV